MNLLHIIYNRCSTSKTFPERHRISIDTTIYACRRVISGRILSTALPLGRPRRALGRKLLYRSGIIFSVPEDASMPVIVWFGRESRWDLEDRIEDERNERCFLDFDSLAIEAKYFLVITFNMTRMVFRLMTIPGSVVRDKLSFTVFSFGMNVAARSSNEEMAGNAMGACSTCIS